MLSHLNTRVVVPLMPVDEVPTPTPRLHPVFDIDGIKHVMATPFVEAVERRQLGPVVAALENRYYEVLGALDVLLSGV